MKQVLRAVEVAIKAHGMTTRKYPSQGCEVPYVIHPVRVMQRVNTYLDEWGGGARFHQLREIMLVVSALHDVTEDTDYPLEEIRREFGDGAVEGLYWLTNPSKQRPDLKRPARKEMDREHLRAAPHHWQVVKMWDRIDNLYDMLNAPHDFIMDVYVPESRLLAEAICEADWDVHAQLVSAIGWLETITKGKN